MNDSRSLPPDHAPLNGAPADFPFGANAPDAPDPFDVERLRVHADDDAALGVRELLVSVRFARPSREAFFRVHPGPDYRCNAGLVELKDADGETFWVDPALWPHLAEEPTFGRRLVVTAVNRQGCPFLWGLRLPGPDGKTPDWVSVPLEAAKAAESRWVKLFWDMSQRRHRVKVSDYLADEPAWPAQTFPELLKLAFKDQVISSLDHPVLKRLRGEV